jgi:hypothetical protein
MPLNNASSHPPRQKPYRNTASALRLRLRAAKIADQAACLDPQSRRLGVDPRDREADLADLAARAGRGDLGPAVAADDEAAGIHVRQIVPTRRLGDAAFGATILRTGRASPVSSDSSHCNSCPASTVASAGTRSLSARLAHKLAAGGGTAIVDCRRMTLAPSPAVHKTDAGPRPITVIGRCYPVTPVSPLRSINSSSATSHKPWRRRRPSALPAQFRSGG